MDVGRFYSSRKLTAILTTFRETAEAVAESSNVRSVVVLPPDAGDSANDSDIEHVPEECKVAKATKLSKQLRKETNYNSFTT